MLCLGHSNVQARYAIVDTEKVPVARLLTNLEKQIQSKPKDLELRYALARVHSMAYALKIEQFDVRKDNGRPFFGYGSRAWVTTEPVRKTDRPEQASSAKEHLRKAIDQYRKAVEIDPKHLPSQLGLGWCLEQSGEKAAALAVYRIALPLAWERERSQDSIFERSMTEEIARYMLPLLDPKKDAAEIKKIKGYTDVISKKGRAITPLAIPLQENAPLEELIDAEAGVVFDLDGSGLERRWGWITPKAGWLVYDATGRGQITSGLQLLGAVTFWIFWKNGYHALAALDNDGDGVLRDEELNGLAIWHDKNGNGVSDPGEVQPLAAWGITALSYQYETHPTGIPYSPHGVHLQDGSARPSYDWTAVGTETDEDRQRE